MEAVLKFDEYVVWDKPQVESLWPKDIGERIGVLATVSGVAPHEYNALEAFMKRSKGMKGWRIGEKGFEWVR